MIWDTAVFSEMKWHEMLFHHTLQRDAGPVFWPLQESSLQEELSEL